MEYTCPRKPSDTSNGGGGDQWTDGGGQWHTEALDTPCNTLNLGSHSIQKSLTIGITDYNLPHTDHKMVNLPSTSAQQSSENGENFSVLKLGKWETVVCHTTCAKKIEYGAQWPSVSKIGNMKALTLAILYPPDLQNGPIMQMQGTKAIAT
ncbi:hypothetical protein ACJX0J_037028, partial [Zea mays]